MGYGIIGIQKQNVELIIMGVIELKKMTDPYLKLKHIFERTLHLIDTYKPDELAIESPFLGKNPQSMHKLGRAQGAAIAACLQRELSITEYAPLKIKQSITGNGMAKKDTVAKMLQNVLHFEKIPDDLDATDGLAAAMCHFYQNKISTSNKGTSSWKSFINNNSNRLKG
ncbi:MAG: crossover junction endodeoxyribonuclease RuvC [Bacteroidales bacterium]|nr:crossover junction endodeoxyribonuclease RuvC [Bacteroidales bacterium]